MKLPCLSLLLAVGYGYELSILHTNDVWGTVMPVHSHAIDCAVAATPNPEASQGNPVESQFYDMVQPACVVNATCAPCAGGIATRVHFFEQVKRAEANVLTVDAGNYYFGSLWFKELQGSASNEYIKYALFADDHDQESEPLYDAMGLGLGDFYLGNVMLAKMLSGSPIPRLLANYNVTDEPSLESCRIIDTSACILPYVVVNKGGRDIGVIGVASNDLHEHSSPGDLVTKVPDPAAQVQLIVDTLASQGVNIIVLLSSMDELDNVHLAMSISGIDVIVATGEQFLNQYPFVVRHPDTDSQVYIVSAEQRGTSIGHLRLTFDDDGIISSTHSASSQNEMVVDAENDTNVDGFSWAVSKLEGYGLVSSVYDEDDENVFTTTQIRGDDGNLDARNRTCTIQAAGADGVSEVEDCVPTVYDNSTGMWTYSAAVGTGKCCGEPRNGLQVCCEKDSMWDAQGCRHADCPLGNLVADAMLKACPTCDVALVNSGAIRGHLGENDLSEAQHLSSILLDAALPFNEITSTMKVRVSTLVDILQHSVAGYSPHHGKGKFLQVAGLRYEWNVLDGSVIAVELCSEWSTTALACTGTWTSVQDDLSKIITINVPIYMRNGGDAYDQYFREGKIFEVNDAGVTLHEAVTDMLSGLTDKTYTASHLPDPDCHQYHANGFLDRPATKCRSAKVFKTTPFKCLVGNPVEGLERGFVPLPDSEGVCSGYGICKSELEYQCDCKATLLEGFEYPRQYRVVNNDAGVCEVDNYGTLKRYVGLTVARGSDCSEYIVQVSVVGDMEWIGVLCGMMCLSVGLLLVLHTYRYRDHCVVIASQPKYVYILSISALLGALFCFVSILPATAATCNMAPTLGLSAYILLVTPIFIKNRIVHQIMCSSNAKAQKVRHSKSMQFIGLLVVGGVLLCVILGLVAPYHPTIVEMDNFTYSVSCDVRTADGGSMEILWAVVLIAVASVFLFASLYYVILTRKLHSIFNESRPMGYAVYNMLLIGSTLLPIMFMMNSRPTTQVLIRIAALTMGICFTILLLLASKHEAVLRIPKNTSIAQLLFAETGTTGVTAEKPSKSNELVLTSVAPSSVAQPVSDS